MMRKFLAATVAAGALALGIMTDRAEAAVYDIGFVPVGVTESTTHHYGLLEGCLLGCSDQIKFSTDTTANVKVTFGITGLASVGLLSGFTLTDNQSNTTYSQAQLANLGLLGIVGLNNPTSISLLGLAASSYTLTMSRLLSLTSVTGTASVAVTPLPAAGWFLLSALGGLAAVRRVRKA